MAPRPALFFLPVFYAFRTQFQRVFDKSFSHPADPPPEALKTVGFYPSKCVGRLMDISVKRKLLKYRNIA